MLARLGVVLTSSTSTQLADQLAALARQTLAPIEVVVVASRGSGAVAEQLASFGGDLRLRALSPRRGWSEPAGWNEAWRSCTSDVVVFLSRGHVPIEGWLEQYAEAFAAGPLQLCSGPTPPPARSATQGWSRLQRELPELIAGAPGSLMAAFALRTTNTALTRAALEQSGGFRPSMRRLADVELGLRLWAAGFRFGFASGAVVHSPREPGDDDVGDEDLKALFQRHPYRDLARVACWIRDSPPDEPLRALATTRDEPLPAAASNALGRGVAPECLFDEAEMLAHLVDTSPSSAGDLATYLQRARSEGLYTGGDRGRPLFDRHHTTNWLEGNTTFRQDGYRGTYGFNRPTARQLGDDSAQPRVVRARGRHEVSVSPEALEIAGPGATLSILLPVASEVQTDVCITGISPPEAEAYVDRARGIIERFPVPIAGGVPLRVSYDFDCVVHEQLTASAARPGDPHERHLRTTLAAHEVAEASRVVREVLSGVPDADGDPSAAARALYAWVADHTTFGLTSRAPTSTLESGFGPCFHRVRLLANLYRLAGIAARERCGCVGGNLAAAAGAPDHADHVEVRAWGHSPFLHTWIEYFDAARGWVPVDLAGVDIGARTLTPRNVADPVLAAEIVRRTGLYQDYYFGHLDPHRLRVTDDAYRLPTYPVGRATRAGDLSRLVWGTRHRLSFTVRPA